MDEALRERIDDGIAAIYHMGGRYGFRDKMCRDCAFRPDSPEMAEYKDVGFGTKVMLLLEDLEFLFRDGTAPSAFVCHQGMPTGPAGPPDYQPPRDERGNPVGYALCAGWLQKFNEHLDADNERREKEWQMENSDQKLREQLKKAGAEVADEEGGGYCVIYPGSCNRTYSLKLEADNISDALFEGVKLMRQAGLIS